MILGHDRTAEGIVIIFLLCMSLEICADGDNNMNVDKILIPVGFAALGVSLGISHLVALEAYSSFENTISQLAAQNYTNAGIMRLGLFSLGSTTSISSIQSMIKKEKSLFQTVPMLLY